MADQRRLIIDDTTRPNNLGSVPTLPPFDFTTNTTFDVSPPESPSHFAGQSYAPPHFDRRSIARDTDATTGASQTIQGPGLGISDANTSIGPPPPGPIRVLPRSVGHTASLSINSENFGSPYSANPLIGGPTNYSTTNTPDLRRERYSPETYGSAFEAAYPAYEECRPGSNVYQPSTDYGHYIDSTAALKHAHSPSMKSAYETDFQPTHECPASKDIHMSRFSWVSACIIIICLFSCVFSGIFVGLAIKAPRYGRAISSQGRFKPSDAIILTSIMAKLVELSFVTAFVAFLGQVLSRRAFMKQQGRGVTLSEMSMWRWIVQPGTLITHWEVAKYAGLSLLGILSLLSAVLATLYTPAVTAVVQPVLQNGRWELRNFEGVVETDFANLTHVKGLCQTPIRFDQEYAASTCMQIDHAGQGYYNYQKYLSSWNMALDAGNGTSDQSKRPQAFGQLYENTTATGQWINIIDTSAVSKDRGRIINNVSLAMPHSGIFAAARNPKNDIMQPEELNSEGSYTLRASVPSAVMNVLCANMNESELEPIVYSKWNNAVIDGVAWQKLRTENSSLTTTFNDTLVDDLFGWTKQRPGKQDYPPVFARLPGPFNTIMNHTSGAWGRPAIYILGQGGKNDDHDTTGSYVLCRLQVSVTPKCSTRYTVTGSGGTMEANCEDEKDEMAYKRTHPQAKGIPTVPNWRDVGTDWSTSLSLNTGIDDANASNSRLLTQLILRATNNNTDDLQVDLDPSLPSVAEALAVLSSTTLLKSQIGAPFLDNSDFPDPPVLPVIQAFSALLQSQQYASGGSNSTSKLWIVILVLVFLLNLFVMTYFLSHNGLVTDFSEPPNLFALAVNSPPSGALKGSCGGGPEKEQFRVRWFVRSEGGHLFVEPGVGRGSVEELGIGGDGMGDEGVRERQGVFGAFGARLRGLGFWKRKRMGNAGGAQGMGIGMGMRGGFGRDEFQQLEEDDVVEDKRRRTRVQYEMLSKRRSVL